MATTRANSTRQTKRFGVAVSRYSCALQARRPHGGMWASAQNIGGGFEGVFVTGSLIGGKLDREATAGP